MTGSSKDFLTYFLCTQQGGLVADGSCTLASGTGSINCTPTILLISILHIPSFSDSLLFISALTRDFNYKIEFFSNHCVLQDLQIEKTIGISRLQDDLYVLNRSQNVIGNQTAFRDTDVHRKILQLHRRLGHLFFLYSRKIISHII